MIVFGRELVENASKRLRNEKVPHGVIMANHWNKNRKERIQIASISTLARMKPEDLPQAEIVIIDEAHLATSEIFQQIIKMYPNAYFLLCTATPYPPRGMGHMVDSVVKPTSAEELINEGFLVDARYFSTFVPNLKGVAKSEGDFNQKQLEPPNFRFRGYGQTFERLRGPLH